MLFSQQSRNQVCTSQLGGRLADNPFKEDHILTVQVLLLRSAHFMCGGFAHCLTDSRPSHAVLRRGDPIRDRLARHRCCFSLSSITQNNDPINGSAPNGTEL
ncbi:hypothetical protein ATANTOWER_006757 [Ataeniobius toweri]|uniref:Uncharacterized protein n=1 Tax=Ataeniobius toweri TaxID=208326 RepID=A0ABU7BT83_9TELE|nr:hypothetical protein [Ataeniobius toweri]